jgi:hypothetical protein|tara:strand:- start:1229 stop:1714 length:486 start_codon:yes stop_codon:yes gene_type:complete
MSSKLFGALKSIKNVVKEVVPGAKAIDLAPKLENLTELVGDTLSNNPVAHALNEHPAIEALVDKVVDLAPIPEAERKMLESVLGVGDGQLSSEQVVVGKAVVEQKKVVEETKKSQQTANTHLELLSTMAVSNQKQVTKLEDRIEELEKELNEVIEHLNGSK